MLPLFWEDIDLVAPVRSVAIYFVFVKGLLTVGVPKAFLTEVLVAIVLIYIRKEASEVFDPCIMTSPV